MNGHVVDFPYIRPYIALLKQTRGGYECPCGGSSLLVATYGRKSALKWPIGGYSMNRTLDSIFSMDKMWCRIERC